MKDMTGETSEPRLPPATRGFKPYPAYKDSGFEWLAKIPAHWDVKRLWHLTPFDRRIMYGIVLPGPNVEDGVPIVKGGDVSPERLRLARLNRTTFEIESGHVRSRLRGGDLVYAIRGSIGEVAIVPDELEGANLTQDAARIAYTSATHGSWLLHALKSAAVFAQLEAGALGATISGINIRDLKRASIPVPPRAEQETIATFLGRETARIDGLVVKKKRLIELLQEKRAALITRAVSKGLDPSVPMKDSGVEWLRQVPAHWDTGALARWWRVIDCKHRTVPLSDDGIPVVSIGEVQSLEVDVSRAKRTPPHEYRQMVEGGRDPRMGDIIYSRNATVGAAALVTGSDLFCLGQDVSLLRATNQDGRFLVFLLRSSAVMRQLDAFMIGSTFNRINVSDIKLLHICIPPLREQREIAAFCMQEHERIQRLIDSIREAIDRLKELRSALISAAVTGKIDVRAA